MFRYSSEKNIELVCPNAIKTASDELFSSGSGWGFEVVRLGLFSSFLWEQVKGRSSDGGGGFRAADAKRG